MDMSIASLAFQGIPEMIAFSLLVMTINNDLSNWKKGILLGIFLGILMFLIRMLPIAFGVHTLLVLIIAIIIFKRHFNYHLFTTIKITILGLLLIASGEFISLLIFNKIIGLTIEEVMLNEVLRILWGWSSIILLLAAACIANTKLRRKYYRGL